MRDTTYQDTPLGGALSSSMALKLAGLHGSSADAIAATIALWPFGYRVTLHGLGIISDAPDEARYQLGEATPFEITELGHEVIAQCAEWAGPGLSERMDALVERGGVCR